MNFLFNDFTWKLLSNLELYNSCLSEVKHSNSYNWNSAPISQSKKQFPFVQLSGLLEPLQSIVDMVSITWIHTLGIRGILY